jgi:hypothetical protein
MIVCTYYAIILICFGVSEVSAPVSDIEVSASP